MLYTAISELIYSDRISDLPDHLQGNVHPPAFRLNGIEPGNGKHNLPAGHGLPVKLHLFKPLYPVKEAFRGCGGIDPAIEDREVGQQENLLVTRPGGL